MHSNHTTTPLQALYRIFILPTLSTPPTRQRLPSLPPLSRSRPFTTTPHRTSKTRAPELRAQKWNEEIRARQIYLLDPTTNRLIDPETNQHPPPVTLYDTLRNLDTKTHRLVQLSDDPIPICKIVSKKESYEADKKRKLQQKERQRVQKVVTEAGQKTIELNWAIAQGDLSHRLKKLKDFLDEGRRVEVVLAAKKRQRKATKEECENVLAKVKEAVGEVEGAKEKEEWNGKMGGLMTVMFQGKPIKAVGGNGGDAGGDIVNEQELPAVPPSAV